MANDNNPDQVQKLAGGILQPPRAFRITLNFQIPADTRPDEFWKAFFMAGVSLSIDRSNYGRAGQIDRVAVVEGPNG